jgi:3-hydroxybutyryl-CoA dehydrogenase
MQIVVLANDGLKEELLSNGVQPGADIIWIQKPEEFLNYPKAFACMDLVFEKETQRIQILENLLPVTVIINSVEHTLQETNPSFIRINAWNSFLKSNLIEGAATTMEAKQKAEAVFAQFNKKMEWLSDEPGFVTPRVVSMIINEAFISLEEGISSKEEINTAMKLGTNYPYGPFEWAEKIGLKKVTSLLQKLSINEKRYEPSSLLTQQK